MGFAIFGSTTQDKEFCAKIRYPKKLKRQVDILADPEQVGEDSALRHEFINLSAIQDRIEFAELNESKTRTEGENLHRNQIAMFDASHATLSANASPSMPGALPRVVLSMIFAVLGNHSLFSSDANTFIAPKTD